MKPELKNLTEKQDKELGSWGHNDDDGNRVLCIEDVKNFIAKVRKESIEYERERIKKEFIKGMKEIATKEL